MKKVLFLIVVLSLLLLSCGRQSSADYNFKQGVKEVRFDFLKGSPPSIVFPDSTFKIVSKIDNQAAYDIKNLNVQISGLDNKFYRVVSSSKVAFPLLEGRSASNPAGDKEVAEFTVETGNLLAYEKQFKDYFLLEASYESTMEFAESICLNPSLYDINDGGCRVDERERYSGQGAPLAVTKLDEVVSPGDGAQVEFRLTLRSRGKGRVKTATLKEARLGNKDINCIFRDTGKNKKKFTFSSSKKEAILICKSPILSYTSYVTTFSAAFDYDYEYAKRQRITLRR